MSKFFITGCTGFVASYLIEYLLKTSKDIEILGIAATRETFSIDATRFTYQQVNMLDEDRLRDVLTDYQPDYIIHLAAISSVGQSWSKPAEAFRNNTNIFLNLLESVRVLQLNARILSVGSSEVYEAIKHTPLTEKDSAVPKSPYAVARMSQEMLSKLYANSYGLDIVMTRSFNHTGPRQRDNFVVSSFVKQLVEISLGKKESGMSVGNTAIVRDFLDVRDVVRAYDTIITHGKSGELYNVCSGQGIKLQEIITVVSRILNILPEINIDQNKIRPTDNMVIIGDNTRLREELHWNQTYAFSDTLNDMVMYWKKELS